MSKYHKLKEAVIMGTPFFGAIGAALFLGYQSCATNGTVTGERVFRYAGNDHYELELVNKSGRKQIFQFHGENSNIYRLQDDIGIGDSVTIVSPPLFLPDEYGIRHSNTYSVRTNPTIGNQETLALHPQTISLPRRSIKSKLTDKLQNLELKDYSLKSPSLNSE